MLMWPYYDQPYTFHRHYTTSCNYLHALLTDHLNVDAHH